MGEEELWSKKTQTNKQTKTKTSKTEEMTESRTNKYNNKKKQYNQNGSYQCDNIT